MEEEIGDQTFQFTSEELAQILSPKMLKENVVVSEELLHLEAYNCMVEGDAFEVALDDAVAQLEPFPSNPLALGARGHLPSRPMVSSL